MRARLCLSVAVLAGLLGPGWSAGAHTIDLARQPGPKPTAEQVLDARIPGRPKVNPLAVPATIRADGFDARALYSVDQPGTHPRLLFSRSDLPRIRRQLEATARGRFLRSEWRRLADEPRVQPGSWLGKAMAALETGDPKAFAQVQGQPDNPTRTGPPGSTTNFVQRALLARAFVAWLDDDAPALRQAAVAVDTYNRWLRPQLDAALAARKTDNYWNSARAVMGDSGTVGLLYDLTQPGMTAAQADNARSLIAAATNGLFGLGMDLPTHMRNWNFIGMAATYPLMALAIEGEPGFEPRLVERGFEVARDNILYAASANGIGREAIGYQSVGFSHATAFQLAMANRGRNLFVLDRWRRMFDTWMVWSLQPFGGQWASEGDLGTYPPYPALIAVAKGLFPNDPGIDLVARQAPAEKKIDGWSEDMLMATLFPVELGTDRTAGVAPGNGGQSGLSLFDAERGILYARTGWNADALSLQLFGRTDTINASHDHPDRGSFVLSALGRIWVPPRMRETESRYHALVAIDGRGQGYFPTPVRWTHKAASDAGVSAIIDQSYAYNWRWMKSSFLASDAQLAAEPWLEVFRSSRDRLLQRVPRDRWERDPSPSVRAFWEPFAAGDPRIWGDEDSWPVRTAHNPVEKAFRALAMVRGANPFIVIADDIVKDGAEHLYEWRLPIASDIEVHAINGADIILGPVSSRRDGEQRGDMGYTDIGRPLAAKGTPMLLVRVLSMASDSAPDESSNIGLLTYEQIKQDDTHQFAGRSFGIGKMLVVPARSRDPRFRILIMPFRQGEALPVTTVSGNILTVARGGKVASLAMVALPDGSTRLDIRAAP